MRKQSIRDARELNPVVTSLTNKFVSMRMWPLDQLLSPGSDQSGFFLLFRCVPQSQDHKMAQLRTKRLSQSSQMSLSTASSLSGGDFPKLADADDDDTIDEQEMIMDLVMDITTELDLSTVTHRILQVAVCFSTAFKIRVLKAENII